MSRFVEIPHGGRGIVDEVACRICGANSLELMCKEINVSCGDYFEGKRLYPQNLGSVALYECPLCGFASFDEIGHWSESCFRERIYNDEYYKCDPKFQDIRPMILADWLVDAIAPTGLVDYGGGDGKLAELLNARNFNAISVDPFYGSSLLSNDQFKVVTAFEVVEHVPDQDTLFRTLRDLCRIDGIIVISTLLKSRRLKSDWWYASPRNGHISFHTTESLRMAAGKAGLYCHSISNEMHILSHQADPRVSVKVAPPRINDTPSFEFIDYWQLMRSISYQ